MPLIIPQNTNLEKLNCSYNKLSGLDLSNNTKLVSLNFSGTDIYSIDIGMLSALTELVCSKCDLASLNVSNNPLLSVLDCGSNTYIKVLDVSSNTELTELYCSNISLSALDLTYNTKLTKLDVSVNNLVKLDVSMCPELTEFNCSLNPLTSLDLSNNKKLDWKNSKVIGSGSGYVLQSNSLDELKQYGFDPAKASSWDGADYVVNLNEVQNFHDPGCHLFFVVPGDMATDVYYSYDVGGPNNLEVFIKGGIDETFNKPTNVKAEPGNGSVKLTWDEAKTEIDSQLVSATRYAVYACIEDNTTEDWEPNGSLFEFLGETEDCEITLTGLSNGKEYNLVVRAFNGSNGSKYTNADFVTVTPTNPTKPENVKATAGDGQVTLEWGAITGAAYYRVMVNDGTKWTGYNSTELSYTVKGLTNDRKYGFAVKAYVDGAYGETSDVVYATPKANIIPQNVKAGAGDSKVQVKWDAVTGAAYYRVMVYDGTTWTGYNTTETSYMVRNLTNGTKYAFAVKAYVGSAYSAASTTVYATPVKSIVPQNVKASAGDSKVHVKWDAVTEAAYYRVMVYDGTKWTGYNTTETSYMVRNLTNGTKYAFAVKSYVGSAYSAVSTTVYATPVSSTVPQNVRAGAGDSKVQVKWDAVTGAAHYRVMVYDGTKWTGYNTTETSYMVRNLVNGTKYAFAVKAYVGSTYGAVSTTVYATPNA